MFDLVDTLTMILCLIGILAIIFGELINGLIPLVGAIILNLMAIRHNTEIIRR